MSYNNQNHNRVVLIILDGVGIGELPDADEFGDAGSDTLGNLARERGGFDLPNFQRMGLGNISRLEGMNRVEKPIASYGKMASQSPAKDSTTGHWELSGLIVDRAFPLEEGPEAHRYIQDRKNIGKVVLTM